MSSPVCSLPATDRTRECRAPAVYRMRLDQTALVAYACTNHRDVIMRFAQEAAVHVGDRLLVDRLVWQAMPLTARVTNGR